MPSIKSVGKIVCISLHILFMYIIPILFFAIPMATDQQLSFVSAEMQTGEKAQIILVLLSTLFVGLLFYVGYLKIKISELMDQIKKAGL